ncbi:hypothetical protein Tco_0456178 [Tanacetum coccineum]
MWSNATTKKTQKNSREATVLTEILATSAESLDSIFNRLQKIVSRLAILVVVQNLAFMTAPSSSSTNDANTAYSQVSAASPSVNTASPQVCTASVSDNTVYAFMVENPNGSKCGRSWGRWSVTTVIKLGHFARECRASRSKEDQFRNKDNMRRARKAKKEKHSKAMLAIDGVGLDWSDMAEEQVQTNMALMAFSDSEKQYDDLLAKQLQTKFEASTYKRGLDTVEAQLVTYRKNEFDGGYVAFGGGAYGGKISRKGTLKTANLDFEDV